MSSNNKYTDKEKKQIDDFKSGAAPLAGIGFAILAAVGIGLWIGIPNFGQIQGIKADSLQQLPARWQYVLQHSTPGVLWLIFCLIYVISRRVETPAVDPSAGFEHLTQLAKNIALNSLEQFILSLVSQLILVTHLAPATIINVIPAINLLFIAGRLTFFLGYPRKRSLGFVLTFIPTFFIVIFIGYRYVKLFV